MRSFLFGAGLFIASVVAPLTAQAEQVEAEAVQGEALPAPIVLTPELIEAHHAYQLAQLRWQQYRFQELPQKRQLLDQQIRSSEAAITVLKRRIRDYRPFLQVGRYSPVRTAAENDRLALLTVEQELKLLRTQRINLMWFQRQNGELYQLDVLRTASRVLQLSAEAQQAATP